MGSEYIFTLFIIKIGLLFYDKLLILHDLNTNTNIIVCNRAWRIKPPDNSAKIERMPETKRLKNPYIIRI